MSNEKLYTRDEAALMVSKFEYILQKYDIHVPCPEDDERSEDDWTGLYGSVYSELLDDIEDHLIEILERSKETEVLTSVFSGKI